MGKMSYNNILSRNLLSEAISWMRFPLILMIVLLHCYCSIDANGHQSFFKWVYPFGLWLGETGVPAFFFVSGFLFYYSRKTYGQKLKSRSKTLLVPYLFWNALLLLIYALLEISGHGMLIAGKSISDYDVVDYARAFIDRGQWDRGNGVPMLCPYWYIRNLMVLCVLSPIIYSGIRYLKWILLLSLFLWWIIPPYNGMIASSLFFFCLGAYFSIRQNTPLIALREYKFYFFVVWFLVFLIDWAHCFWNIPYALYVHRVSLVLNVFCLLLVGSYLGNRHYLGRELLDNSTFWVYTIHYPMTIALGTVFTMFLKDVADWQLFAFYWCGVLCITILCVVSYVVLHRLCPQVLSFITGNRS